MNWKFVSYLKYKIIFISEIFINKKMSMLNFSGDESPECPLCMELLELDDINFFPCACGYQVSDYALVLFKVVCISPLLIIDF